MAIEKYKVRSGIFVQERVKFSGEDLESNLKAYFESVDKVEPLMQRWEDYACKVLEQRGYPASWKELSLILNEGEHPSQIHDIESMLFHFDMVRKHLHNGKAEAACWNMAFGIEAAMRAQIRPIEPAVITGVKVRKATREAARQPRKTTRGKRFEAAVLEAATARVKNNPEIGLNELSRTLQEQFGKKSLSWFKNRAADVWRRGKK